MAIPRVGSGLAPWSRAPPAGTLSGMNPSRIFGIVAGSFSGLAAVVLLLAGGGLLWAVDAHTHDDGYFGTKSHRYSTPTRAIATQSIDLDDLPGNAASLRIRPRGAVFVGVAKRSDVQAYLAGVDRDEIEDVDFYPFRVSYDRRSGSRVPAPPASQDFWVATATGGKPLQWRVREGDWSVVAMNADGSPGVDVAATVEAKIPILHRLAVWALILGGVLAAIATALLTWAATARARVATPA
jgi:hypothetical protein